MDKYNQYLRRKEAEKSDREKLKSIYTKSDENALKVIDFEIKTRTPKSATDEDIRRYVCDLIKLAGFKYSISDINKAIDDECNVKHKSIIRFVYWYYTAINRCKPEKVTVELYMKMHEELGLKPIEGINPVEVVADINTSINKSLASFLFVRLYVSDSAYTILWSLLINTALRHNYNYFFSVPYEIHSIVNSYSKQGKKREEKLDEFVSLLTDKAFEDYNTKLEVIHYEDYKTAMSNTRKCSDFNAYLKSIGSDIPESIRHCFCYNDILAGVQFILK